MKYQKLTPSGGKDIIIRKFKFVEKSITFNKIQYLKKKLSYLKFIFSVVENPEFFSFVVQRDLSAPHGLNVLHGVLNLVHDSLEHQTSNIR